MNSGNKTVMKTIIGLVIFALVIAVVYYAYSYLKNKYEPTPFTIKKPTDSSNNNEDGSNGDTIKAPEFVVYNNKGEEVNFSEFIGKPIIINFWTTWCPYCKEEMQDFNDVYLQIKDDVHFMMVNQTDGERETRKKADNYIKENGFEFPVYYDLDFSASNAYAIQYLPTTIFIDSNGNFVTGYSGPISKETLNKHINELKK